jgi:hypothetical protein
VEGPGQPGMETEKRIGYFRVNRKVAWGMCFSTAPAQP